MRFRSERLMRARLVAAVCAMAIVVAGASPVALASPTTTLRSGKTTVTLDAGFVAALGALGVTPAPIKPGKLKNGAVSFPISGGAIDVANAKGEIAHTGGLSLTAGSTVVELLNFTIDTSGASPVLTGVVTANGSFVGRLPLFDLDLPAITLPITPDARGRVTIPGVGVTLTVAAAAALNDVFGVTAFEGGFAIGTATVATVVGAPKAKREE